GLVEALDPVGAGTLRSQLVDFRIDSVAIRRSMCPGCVFGTRDQLRRFERVAKTLPNLLAGGRYVDMAVRGLENAGWNAGGMIVAGLLGDFPFHEPARRLEIEHEDLGLQQG